MGFSRQELWTELPCPPPGDLPDPRIEPVVSWVFCIAGGFFTTESTGKPKVYTYGDVILVNLHIWPQVQSMVSNFCLLVIKRIFVALADYSIPFLLKI